MSSLDHLKEAHKNLDRLEKARFRESYIGSGIRLYVDLGEGATDGETIDLQFGISTDINLLVDNIIRHQRDVVRFWENAVIRERDAITNYLASCEVKRV